MAVIRAEHVAELLRSTDSEAVLVVRGGAAEVVPRARLAEPGYRGAFQVASRRDLEGEAEARGAEALARGLDAAVEELGG